MIKKTRKLVLCAIFSALASVILYLSSIWPTGQIGFAAAASLFVAAAVIEAGALYGLYVYLVSSALALLLIPNRSPLYLYISFFGYYPILKSLTERLRSVPLQWAVKLLVFNISLSVFWFVIKELIFDFSGVNVHIALVYLGGSAVFALFDYGFTKAIWFYINRISKRGNV